MPRDYRVKFDDNNYYLVEDVPDDVHPNDVITRVEQQFKRPVQGMTPMSKPFLNQAADFGKSLVRGAGQTVGFFLDRPGYQDPLLAGAGVPAEVPPGQIQEKVGEALPVPKFESTGERYTRAGAEALGGALLSPGAMAQPIRSAVGGLGAGLGAEVGQDVTDSPIGRVIGAFMGGLTTAIGGAPRTNVPALARETLEGVNPQDLQRAGQVMQTAQQQGLPMNLSQAMGKPSNIDDMVAELAQSRHGNQTIEGLRRQSEILQQQAPAKVAALPGRVTSPQEAANRTQKAATGALQGARDKANLAYSSALRRANAPAFDPSSLQSPINPTTRAASMKFEDALDEARFLLGKDKFDALAKQTKPAVPTPGQDPKAHLDQLARKVIEHYDSVPQARAQVPMSAIKAFEQQLDAYAKAHPNTEAAQMAASVKARLRLSGEKTADPKQLGSGKVTSSILLKQQGKEPEYITDPVQLKNAVDDAIQGYGQNMLNTGATPRDLNRYAANIRDMWKQSVRSQVPGMDDAAKAAREVYLTQFNPMKKSVTGRISGTRGATDVNEAPQAQILSLLKRGTPPGGQSDILKLEKDLRKVDPEAFPELVKTHISDAVAAAMKSPSNRAPDNFAKALHGALYGTPQQQQGMRDMLAGVARSKGLKEADVVRGFEGFLKLSGHLANRPPRVSGMPAADIQDVAGASKIASALEVQYWTQTGRKIRHAFSGDAYRTMDALLNTPEGIKTLQVLADKSIMSPQAANALGAFYATLGDSDRVEE